ncbi:hypothetical protein [Helicobacter valdiviensis]|nr:hypothetical protein [Helicobacter valdiviensis]
MHPKEYVKLALKNNGGFALYTGRYKHLGDKNTFIAIRRIL